MSVSEVRDWARGLGLPVKAYGRFPVALFDRWDQEHPDRPADRPEWAYALRKREHPRTLEEMRATASRAGLASAASKRGVRP